MFSLSNAIKLMLLVGVLAVVFVGVKGCQGAPDALDAYARGSLKRLTQMEAPPAQPALTFRTADGAETTLADFRGQTVLLNVWATWCAPCVAEMPTLAKLQEMRGDADFQVVTVSLDRTPEEAARWMDRQGITALTPWHDASFGLSTKVQAPGLPVSILYSPSGREIARVSGEADWVSEEALALIDYVSG